MALPFRRTPLKSRAALSADQDLHSTLFSDVFHHFRQPLRHRDGRAISQEPLNLGYRGTPGLHVSYPGWSELRFDALGARNLLEGLEKSDDGRRGAGCHVEDLPGTRL